LIFKFLDSNLEDKRFCTQCVNIHFLIYDLSFSV
jgi:hypothetical protein